MRITLDEIRSEALELVGDEWTNAGAIQRALGLPGRDWYRVALVLERAASDGELELRGVRGSGRRWYRRARP